MKYRVDVWSQSETWRRHWGERFEASSDGEALYRAREEARKRGATVRQDIGYSTPPDRTKDYDAGFTLFRVTEEEIAQEKGFTPKQG